MNQCLQETLRDVRLYDASARSNWDFLWWRGFIAQTTFIYRGASVGAITIGPNQFYNSGEYPATPGSRLALIAHETFHSFHSTGTMNNSVLFLGAYLTDCARAGIMEWSPYEKNLSEIFGHAMQDAVNALLTKYPDAFSWFDPNSPNYGKYPPGVRFFIYRKFIEALVEHFG